MVQVTLGFWITLAFCFSQSHCRLSTAPGCVFCHSVCSCISLQCLALLPNPHGLCVLKTLKFFFQNLRISSCVCLLGRMLQLSVPGLDLGSVVTSPWHLLLLGAASWILARILAWTYSFCENCSRLTCFPQPPKKNWFLGHLGMVSMTGDAMGYGGVCVPKNSGKVWSL